MDGALASSLAEKVIAGELEIRKFERQLKNFDQHQNEETTKVRAKAQALKRYPPTSEKTDILYRDNLTNELTEKREELSDLKARRDELLKKLVGGVPDAGEHRRRLTTGNAFSTRSSGIQLAGSPARRALASTSSCFLGRLQGRRRNSGRERGRRQETVD